MNELLGYIGPGAGLGFIGSLLAVLAVIGVGVLGLVLYPLRLILSWYRNKSAGGLVHGPGSTQQTPAGRVL
jgi:hypothetical protein